MKDVYNRYYEGIFWLPEQESHKVICTFYINEKGRGVISSLQGLNGETIDTNRYWGKIDVLLGYLSSNEGSEIYSVKLYDVFKSHQSIGMLHKNKYFSEDRKSVV